MDLLKAQRQPDETEAMQLVGLLGFAVFTLASFVVGLRLLHQGIHSRQLPEVTMGSSFVLAGGIAGLLSLVAGPVGAEPAPAGVRAGASLAVALGVALLVVFTWRVFRPRDAWATILSGCLMAALLTAHFVRAGTAGFENASVQPIDWLSLGARIVAYLWAAAEATQHYLAARRRCVIGLGDPLVANRFLLWAVGLTAVLLIWLQSALTMVAGGTHQTAFLSIAVLGFICAAAIWLAFYPPAFYRRRFAVEA